jgi:alpha-galactosidase
MITNPDVIAVDQDSLGIQGTLVREHGLAQIWVKPLAGDARAVAMLNRGSTELRIATTPRMIGMAHAHRYTLENLWTHRTVTTTGAIGARVAPHAAVLYRVAAL